LVIVSGDLTQRARVGQFRRAVAFLQRLPIPQIVLAGNHDIPLYNLFRRMFSPYGRFTQIVSKDLQPTYEDDELLVVGVNTAGRGSLRWNGFWKDGSVSAKDIDRAAVLLAGVPREVVKIVVTHHPFSPPDEKHAGDVVRNGQWALEKLARTGVDLLLGGHLHQAYHAHMDHGAISLQAGTAISTRHRGQPNSYNFLTVAREKIELDVCIYDGGKFVVATEQSWKRNRPQMNTDGRR
jgi:3',5'-cyclic AMP phosphodiesterase CpdA